MIIKISKYRDGWRKFVGGKCFYSSDRMNRETFRLVAGALELRWAALKAAGCTWTEAEIDAAYDTAGVPRRGSPATPAALDQTLAGTLTLHRSVSKPSDLWTPTYAHAAVDAYLAQLRGSVPKQINADHFEKVVQHLGRLKKLLPDAPVDQIEYGDLLRLKNVVINVKKINGEPFAVDSVVTIMSVFKAFFNHLADDSTSGWQAPRGFDRAMKVDRSKLASEDDEDAEDDDLNASDLSTFRLEELAYLWKSATPMAKLVMAFGLFAGFTASDIGTLKKTMIVIEGDEIFIWRKRHKTRHRQKFKTKWWVPPVLASMIRRYMLRTPDDPKLNPKGLLLLTRNDLPLVHRSKDGSGSKTDNVALVWRSTIRAAVKSEESRWLSHKHLRKTGGRLIRYGLNDFKGAGLELAQQFLGHAVKTVAEKNYLDRPVFDELHASQRQVYHQLRPLLEGSAPDVKTTSVTENRAVG